MPTPINRIVLRLIPAAFFAAVLTHRSAEAAELRVCVDQSSPVKAMDAGIAQAVAKQQGLQASIVPFDGSGDDDDGLALSTFPKLLASRCQLVMGFPLDAQGGVAPDGTHATDAYAHTGFVLVTPRNAATTLDQLPKGSEVAVTYMTTPNLYFSAHPRITAQIFTTDDETLKAVAHGDVAAAMLWMPYVAGHLDKTAGRKLQVSPLAEPHAQWNLVALYSADSEAVAQQFEQGVDALRRDGRLQKLLMPYGEVAGGAQVATPHKVALRSQASMPGRLIKVSDAVAHNGDVGLYTVQQAETGRATFRSNCAICHGPDLEGRAGPALKGATFANPEANFHVGDIFKIVSENMPAPAPGTLPHEDYVNVMAYILQQNGYPAGSTALTFDSALKSTVRLVYREHTQQASN
ncbi:c-type cytochrome [Solimonas terrae]|uniref:Transporter substrate-binding domain-containing protein n=1 Tax=Solimonas terrae TaxID=1396819 RepID=A0A6M2BL84_9GAMM|nr:transporter substrate-binding domain-containing protein [Solimonas terrae]NGY03234.1 transporter substrate-binding domain-containing protein [Solimonas terrae]